MTANSTNCITGVILAGGRARRMGGVDKGLVPVSGRPMIEYVLDVVTPQVAGVIINANRNLAHYASYGHAVIADAFGDFAGPLAGMASCLPQVRTDFMLTVPCDSPFVPTMLASRLLEQLRGDRAEICFAHDGNRAQPVFALIQAHLLASLRDFLDRGGRKIDLWYAEHRAVSADFSDQASAFINVNTPEEVREIESRLAQPGRAHG